MADNRPFEKQCAKVIGVARHRLSTDGDGVTPLVAFHGCPLRCRYCLNQQSLGDGSRFREFSPQSLYDEVRIDELYFLATNGGVTFGGGEPCLHPQFIRDFRELCGPTWQLNLETSLNVPTANIVGLLTMVNTLIIDVKDMNPDISLIKSANTDTMARGKQTCKILKEIRRQIADAVCRTSCRSTDYNSSGTKARRCAVFTF